MNKQIELLPSFSSQKSLYKKAFVYEAKDGYKMLYSYETCVATIENGKAYVFGTFSQTTLKHIKEFLLQNGFKADSKKQIENDYMTTNEKGNK